MLQRVLLSLLDHEFGLLYRWKLHLNLFEDLEKIKECAELLEQLRVLALDRRGDCAEPRTKNTAPR